MTGQVSYFYFGRQCPGFAMGEHARQAAELLGFAYRETDISHRPDLAEEHGLFCAGTVVIDGFHIHFPGRPEQLVASFKARGPLPGTHSYTSLPQGELDGTVPLTSDTVSTAFSLCIPGLSDSQVDCKQHWLRQYPEVSSFSGLIGTISGRPVAFVEVLPETRIPYPLGDKRSERAFITCVYSPNEWGLELDYRVSLLNHLIDELRLRGFAGVSVISGLTLPYPNGPEPLFTACGFSPVKSTGQILLRHGRDEAWLFRRQF